MKENDHEKKPMDELPLEHRQVLSLLREGLENAITVNDIQKLTGISSVRIRQCVNQLIVKYGYIIGSSTKFKESGFFIPVTMSEEKLAITQLSSRVRKISEREKALIRNIANKHNIDLIEALRST
ncbi:hypothetical protein [Alkalihalobacterium alkalinitrilicum]|uniref:hypothetical protein n=1 Tax=Alkalihalobacterium alkalinitrilicum TaxID=427920 RepID=UPI001C56064E|nr:hypothetical protein [Alkalihalobacterium alkalinitrilicum]